MRTNVKKRFLLDIAFGWFSPITLCCRVIRVTSWLGKHQMTSTGQGRAHCLSSAEVLYPALPPDETSFQLFFSRHIVPFPVNHTCLGHVLHVLGPSSKCCRGGKSDKTARPRSLCKDTKLGAARKCLNLKLTAQVTGSLQLSFNGRNF